MRDAESDPVLAHQPVEVQRRRRSRRGAAWLREVIAPWATALSIVVLEIAAARRAQLRPQDLWLQARAGAVLGLAIIALKLVLN